jgi:hypothetical protein
LTSEKGIGFEFFTFLAILESNKIKELQITAPQQVAPKGFYQNCSLFTVRIVTIINHVI